MNRLILNFNGAIEKLASAIDDVVKEEPKKKALFYDFEQKKGEYKQKKVELLFRQMEKSLEDLFLLINKENNKIINDVEALAKESISLYNKNKLKNAEELKDVLNKLKNQIKKIKTDKESLNIIIPKLPLEIREDINADIEEIKTCFNNKCYRSCAVLCGRILEVALHRKYYEVANQDILEKNPGIGLGKIIAKLREKKVRFEPGISEQIHLINQIRVNSVHKKNEAFKPTREQCHAMILYTMDVLKKLF